MATIDFRGFECPVISTAVMGGGTNIWSTIQRAAGLSMVAGRRPGGSGLQVIEDGVTLTRLEIVYGGTNTMTVFGFAFKILNSPTGNSQIFRIVHGTSPHSLMRISSAGNAQMGYTDGTGNAGATSVVDGLWHWVTGKVDVSANPNTIDWTLDGVAQPQASKAQAPQTLVGEAFGSSVNANDAQVVFDDFISFDDAAVYPLQDVYAIYGTPPTADGTHALNGHIADNTGATTNLYQALDEATPDTTTYVKQTVIGASDYAEVLFPDIPDEQRIVASRVYLGALAAGVGANNIHVKALDGASSTLVDLSLATNTTTLRYARMAGLGRNTSAQLNEMKMRIGYSSDVIDVPYMSYMFLEYAVERARNAAGAVPV